MKRSYALWLHLAGLFFGAAYIVLSILELTGQLSEGPWRMIVLVAFVSYLAINLLINQQLKKQNPNK